MSREAISTARPESVRHEDAERFIERCGADDPDLASYLRIGERALGAGGLRN